MQPGSWFHHTECFGPVLGVMRADDLDHAIELQNAVEYGLTGGIHTLDDAEIEHWLDRVEVGNAYVNRHTTGAVVRRQPFGGWKRSSVGRGAKTGGPDDIFRFTTFHPASAAAPGADASSYRHWWNEMFGVALDRSGLRAEANVLRYRPVGRVVVRVGADTAAGDVTSLRAAATVAGVPVEISGLLADGRRWTSSRTTAPFAAGSPRPEPSASACSPRATTASAPPATRPASRSTRHR